MRIFIFSIACVVLSSSAAQAACERAWVARNMIFDRAGFCFSSALGQSVFNNTDCTTTAPTLNPADTDAVAQIRETERMFGCQINTSGGPNSGIFQAFAEYSRLIDIPALDHLGFACWGYLGPGANLLAGAYPGAPIIGRIETGQSALYSYWPRNGWTYIDVMTGPGGQVLASGWVQLNLGPEGSLCTQQAG